MDTVSSRSHLTPPKFLPQPRARSPVLSPINCPPPCRGAGGGAERAGRWGVFQRKPFNGRRMRQGRGMLHPPPRQPHPHGVILHKRTAGEEHPFTWFPVKTPRRILFPSPAAAIWPIANQLPAPL